MNSGNIHIIVFTALTAVLMAIIIIIIMGGHIRYKSNQIEALENSLTTCEVIQKAYTQSSEQYTSSIKTVETSHDEIQRTIQEQTSSSSSSSMDFSSIRIPDELREALKTYICAVNDRATSDAHDIMR